MDENDLKTEELKESYKGINIKTNLLTHDLKLLAKATMKLDKTPEDLTRICRLVADITNEGYILNKRVDEFYRKKDGYFFTIPNVDKVLSDFEVYQEAMNL